MSLEPVYTFAEKKPERQYVVISPNKDGSDDLYRYDLEYGRHLLDDGHLIYWRYEIPGEANVYPTYAEWNAIHARVGQCKTPCSACAAAGYDPITGKTVGRRAA